MCKGSLCALSFWENQDIRKNAVTNQLVTLPVRSTWCYNLLDFVFLYCTLKNRWLKERCKRSLPLRSSYKGSLKQCPHRYDIGYRIIWHMAVDQIFVDRKFLPRCILDRKKHIIYWKHIIFTLCGKLGLPMLSCLQRESDSTP